MTLYPGNVISVTAELEQVVVGLGRVLDVEGKAVPNALINGVRGLALTDERGYFQAEIDQGLQGFTVVKSSRKCTVELSEFSSVQNLAMLGDLECVFEEDMADRAPYK